MKLRHCWAVFVCRNWEFLRDRSALAWNILFPLVLIVGFTFAFSEENVDLYKVGVLGERSAWQGSNFFHTRHIQFIAVPEAAPALAKVERHQLDMLIDPLGKRYWINDAAPKGYVLERILRGADSDFNPFSKQIVSGRAIRYVDWVMPGILGMNMMFGCLFGVGYVIVRYRKNGMLKRLKATPLTPLEFITAQIASRLWLAVTATILVFVGTNHFIGFPMHGSYLSLFLVCVLGAMSLISLGLIVAARTRSEEFAGGLLNLCSWPMTFLSGVWFSLEGAHPVLKYLSQLLPLTHVIDAARAIMLDGATCGAISGQLLLLAVMSAVFTGVAAWLFTWD